MLSLHVDGFQFLLHRNVYVFQLHTIIRWDRDIAKC